MVDPGSTAVNVYVNSELPSKASQSFVPIKTQVLQGMPYQKYSIYPYNYLGVFNSQPIYLLQNSALKYTLNINTNNFIDDCPVRLCLFNDTNMYYYFLYHYTSVDVVMCTSCIMESTRINLIINESSLYYVAIQIAANVIVNSTISVDRVYYNTTGLSRPNGCNDPLTSVNSKCEITVCDGYLCIPISKYILLEPNGAVTVNTISTCDPKFLLNWKFRIALFATYILVCILSTALTPVIAICFYVNFKNNAGNVNSSINDNETSNQV